MLLNCENVALYAKQLLLRVEKIAPFEKIPVLRMSLESPVSHQLRIILLLLIPKKLEQLYLE